jgi:hypothetical protein
VEEVAQLVLLTGILWPWLLLPRRTSNVRKAFLFRFFCGAFLAAFKLRKSGPWRARKGFADTGPASFLS